MVLNIKLLRLERGWLQRHLAGRPEVQKARPRLFQHDISDIELGRRIPTPEQLAALARALGVADPQVLLKAVELPAVDQQVGP